MRSSPFARRRIGPVAAAVILALGACSKTPTYVPDLTGGAGGVSHSASSGQAMSSSGGGGAGPGVACANAGDCGTLSLACGHPTCVAGACGVELAPMGTAVAPQISGDCKKNVCDGMGKVIAVADAMDLPLDHNPCTIDTCMGSTAVHTPAPVGTQCGVGNGMSSVQCNAAGLCVGCQDSSQCGPSGPCFTWTCSNNQTCQPSFLPVGTGNPGGGAPGDCQKYACDGTGGVVPIAHPTDVPPSPSACLLGACMGIVPVTQPALAGTPCPGGKCDGAGHCGACMMAADCGMPSPCATPACITNHCSLVYSPQGMMTPTQTNGDCRYQVCDGAGGVTMMVDDADIPPAPDACTTASCSGGMVVHTPVTVVSSNNPCIVDGCDPMSGVYHHAQPNGVSCGGCSICKATTCTNPCPAMGFICMGTLCG